MATDSSLPSRSSAPSLGCCPPGSLVLYLSVPGLEIVAALLKAGVRSAQPRFLLATVFFFVADLVGSLAAVVQHLSDRPYRWHNPRQARDANK